MEEGQVKEGGKGKEEWKCWVEEWETTRGGGTEPEAGGGVRVGGEPGQLLPGGGKGH